MKETLIVIGITALVILIFVAGFFVWKLETTPFGSAGLYIKGNVYEWKDAPAGAMSTIYFVDVSTWGARQKH
jgi:uncharacterized protein YxeA